MGAHSTLRSDGTLYVDGVISGSSKNLTKTGTGAAYLRGTNTYSGSTTISAGTFGLAGAGTLGSGTYAGTISNSGILSIGSSTLQNFDGAISGTGSITKTSTAIARLRTDNTFSGNITVNSSGRLVIEGTLGEGSYAGNISNTSSNGFGVIFNTSSAQTLSGVLSGSGTYSLFDADTSGVLTLTGSNTFSSAWKHEGGTLIVGNDNALSSSPNINLGSTGNTRRLGISNSAELPSLTLSGAKTLTLTTALNTGSIATTNSNLNTGGNDLTTGSANTNTTFAGVISGAGKLIKEGYDLLGLETFFTSGKEESRAWTVRKNTLAPEAAGVIHSDFENGFIRAEVINYDDYEQFGSELKVKEAGKIRKKQDEQRRIAQEKQAKQLRREEEKRRLAEEIGKKISVKFDKFEFLLNLNVNISSNLFNQDFPEVANNTEIQIMENTYLN